MATLPQDQSREGCKLGNMSTSHVEIGVTAAKADALADARAKAAGSRSSRCGVECEERPDCCWGEETREGSGSKKQSHCCEGSCQEPCQGIRRIRIPSTCCACEFFSSCTWMSHSKSRENRAMDLQTWCAQSLCPTVDVATGSLPPPLYHYISCISYHERYW